MNGFSPNGSLDVLAFPTARQAATAAAMDFVHESDGDPPPGYFRHWCARNGRRFGEKAVARGQAAMVKEVALYRHSHQSQAQDTLPPQTRGAATPRQRGWLAHHGYPWGQTADLSKREASDLISAVERGGIPPEKGAVPPPVAATAIVAPPAREGALSWFLPSLVCVSVLAAGVIFALWLLRVVMP